MSIRWVDRALLYSPLYIGICTSESAFRREVRRLSPGTDVPAWLNEGASATCHFMSGKGGRELALICLPPRGRTRRAQYAALIVHEAMHVWRAIRVFIGERHPSSEFEAYAMQAICQELFEAVKL